MQSSSDTLIAIWGNSNSGKTTIAMKMAAEMAARGKDVVVVFADPIMSTTGIVAPLKAKELTKSLGVILQSPKEDPLLIKQQLIPVSNHIAICGYAPGEHYKLYGKYTENSVRYLLRFLRGYADCVLVECGSDVHSGLFSTIALTSADAVVRVMTPDVKAASFMQSNAVMLADLKVDINDHYVVVNKVYSNIPYDIYDSVFGEINYVLPYTEGVDEQFRSTQLLQPLRYKDAMKFNTGIRNIVEDVCSDVLGTKRKTKGKGDQQPEYIKPVDFDKEYDTFSIKNNEMSVGDDLNEI